MHLGCRSRFPLAWTKQAKPGSAAPPTAQQPFSHLVRVIQDVGSGNDQRHPRQERPEQLPHAVHEAGRRLEGHTVTGGKWEGPLHPAAAVDDAWRGMCACWCVARGGGARCVVVVCRRVCERREGAVRGERGQQLPWFLWNPLPT
jgi:hypothetical protein